MSIKDENRERETMPSQELDASSLELSRGGERNSVPHYGASMENGKFI